jgi:deazaflavin-dependent oxidoreductase (nitroreductase family)
MTESREERNRRVIAEFRANAGKVGGPFEGRPMLILHTKGAKSGQPRVTPLVYLPDGDRYLVFASMGGAPTHPAWYHNLVANPAVEVEVGTEKLTAKATVLTGEERDRSYAVQAERAPQFGEYQRKTTRTIPVIALERVG